MADAVPQIVWIVDAEGRNEFFNRQWFDYTGAPPEPTTAARVTTDHVHPDDHATTIAAFEEARRTGQRYRVEHRIRSASGEYRWFLVRGEPYREPVTGQIVRWYGASVDIHDRKMAEDQLRELNETLEARVADALAERQVLADFVESTNTSILAFDLGYRILAINKSNADEIERIYGKRPKVGDNLLELIADMPEHQAQVARNWGRALAGEEFMIIEEFGDAAHERVTYEVRFSLLRDRDGKQIGAYQTAFDVSDRIKAQAELTDAQEALRQSQKMEAMGQLTGGVAHDFNNLLTPIVASLDILQRRGVGSEREQRLIAGAAQSAERATTLVQRLLAFARRQPLQPTAVDVADLVRGMADLVSSTTGPQIRVSVEVGHDVPPAKADPNQLEMALLNLAVNARDAMPEGGTLRITAAAEEVQGPAARRLKLKPGSYVRLSVADTGVGMDRATLARAVEPFFSTKGVGKGTGLGLSMVHGLASQLGGALAIHSRPGLGTNVELWLPQSESRPSVVHHESELAAVQRRGTALLVDDEEAVRLSTTELLEDLGYQVLEVASAEEALSVVRNGTSLDLIITDHLMPGMTGSDLARVVQVLRPGVPVLIISGYAESEGIEPDLPRLTKPFRRDELVASLVGLADGEGS
jgi:PAS domain S-box-containing protein